MNKKQLFCLWFGIVIFVFIGLINSEHYDFEYFLPLLIVYWPIVVVITVGLIYTFRNKKGPEIGGNKSSNFRQGFRRVTIVLSILVGLLSSLIQIPFIISAQDNVQRHQRQLEYFLSNIKPMTIKGFRSKYPGYNDINDLDLSKRMYERFHFKFIPEPPERFVIDDYSRGCDLLDVVNQQKCLEEAKNDFWATLSPVQASALCILVGIAGFCGVWIIYFVVLLIHRLVMWVSLGFRKPNL